VLSSRTAEATAIAERNAAPQTQPPTIERLKQEAKDLGLWNLCVRNLDYAPLAEIMGTHPLAQEATNCDPPSNINDLG